MNLPEWKSLSSYGTQVLPHRAELSGMAIAEVDAKGLVTEINSLGAKKWGWKAGDAIPGDLLIALEGLSGTASELLPVKLGGLFLLGAGVEDHAGWMVMGYASEEKTMPRHVSEFKSLIEKIPLLFLTMGGDGVVHRAGGRAASIVGYTPQQMTQRRFWHEVALDEDLWKLEETLRRVKEKGNAATTIRLRTPDGQVRFAELHFFRAGTGADAPVEGMVFDVTEQAEVDEALFHSEMLYRSFLEQGPIGMLHLDQEGHVTFENHPFRQIVGELPEDAWIGRNILAIPGLGPEAQPCIEGLLAEGEDFEGLEVVYRRASRRTDQYLVLHGSAIRHPEGRIVGGVLMVQEITRQKLRDLELGLRQRYSDAEAALRATALDDPDENAFLCKAARILGETTGADRVQVLRHIPLDTTCTTLTVWTAASAPKASLHIRYSDYEALDELARLRRSLFLARPEADPQREVLLALTGADEAVWVPFFEPSRLDGFVIIEHLEDDTKEHAAPWEAAERERIDALVRLFETLWGWILMSNRYRQTVATIDDALFNFTFDERGERRFLFITEQAERLTGYTLADLAAPGEEAVSWVDHLVILEDRTQVRVHDMALQHGEESRVVYRVRHRSGSIRWLREHATPLRDEAGFITVSGMLTDVTEQKAAEELLLKAKQEAESSNRHKTQFIATMSHEIRTPLGAVNGYSQLLANELEEVASRLGEPLPPQVNEFIEAIQERSEQLLTLVNDLFDLSNIEMGTVALQRVAFPLQPVVERVCEKLMPALEAKGIAACVDVQADVSVLGDPRRLEQVINILMANATKFTEAGSVTLRAESIAYEVVVEVIDSGVGISEAHMERLFTPFAQEEDWRNRQYEGAGLGLTLVKRLLDLMEGRIEVESRKGEGSTFRVFLPAARRSGTVLRPKTPQPRRHSS